MQRGHQNTRQAPGRFRCLVCKEYVSGTESGHCPKCGFVPPSAPAVPPAMTSINPIVALAVLAIVVAILAIVTNSLR
jgi:hypothetical protein